MFDSFSIDKWRKIWCQSNVQQIDAKGFVQKFATKQNVQNAHILAQKMHKNAEIFCQNHEAFVDKTSKTVECKYRWQVVIL
jgi:hypothetical protein